MPQLRDKLTSELVAELDTIEEALALEEELRGEVLLDGVGAGFDPEAFRKVRGETISRARKAAGDNNADQAQRAEAKRIVAEAERLEKRGKGKAGAARDAIAEVRARRDKAMRG